ncbi:MAG TPA: class I SAM-dependent methyltransferase [Patescibacteria group bacterium]
MIKRKEKRNKKEFIWSGMHPFFIDPFISYFTPGLKGKVVVDCGCGKGMVGYLTRATRDLEGGKMIGLDSNEKMLSFCREHKVYDKLIKNTLPKLPFKDKSVDFLMCTEVIEHLSKKDGQKFLKEVDRVCRGRAIVSTPNVFFDNPPGEKQDVHQSLWKTRDFKDFGYKVYGLGVMVPFVGENPKFLKIKQAFYYIFTPFCYFIPQISANLLCVKDFS